MEKSGVGRRVFIQGIGATAAGGVALGHSHGPVGEAEALPPLIVAGAAGAAAGALLGGAAGVGLGWAVRSFDPLGSDDYDEDLAEDAYYNHAYRTILTRKSTNESTIVDNRNILDGVEHTAWIDAKIAAIEMLNDEEAQQTVEDAAVEAAESYITTVQENFIKSWNESVNELASIADTSEFDYHSSSYFRAITDVESPFATESIQVDDFVQDGANLADGSGMTVEGPASFDTVGNTFLDAEEDVSSYVRGVVCVTDPDMHPQDSEDDAYPIPDGGTGLEVDQYDEFITYMDVAAWREIWLETQDLIDNLRTGLTTWVDSVYSDLQSGDLDFSELVTPRERSAMIAEEGGIAQAIADLQALNIPVDVGREVRLSFDHIDGSVSGTLAMTDDSTTIEVGGTYDPATIDGPVFLTYDASLGDGAWSAYEDGVDGGVAVFTSEPFEGVEYHLQTGGGEAVTMTREDFTPVDENGEEIGVYSAADTWEIDLSDDLENSITEIDEVRFFSESDETDIQTARLQEPFTVESITDVESGSEEQSLTFERSEPQTDDNYVTQEEWDELQAQNEEIIQRFEDAEGGGGFGFGDFDLGPIPGGGVVVGAIAVAAYLLGR